MINVKEYIINMFRHNEDVNFIIANSEQLHVSTA